MEQYPELETRLNNGSKIIHSQLAKLRILDNKFKIKVAVTEHDTVGVDTPDDLERVKKILDKEGIRNNGITE